MYLQCSFPISEAILAILPFFPISVQRPESPVPISLGSPDLGWTKLPERLTSHRTLSMAPVETKKHVGRYRKI